MILIDIFTWRGDLILWCKDKGKDVFVKKDFRPVIYFETFNETFSRKILKGCKVEKVKKKHISKGEIEVLKITFSSIHDFRKNFKNIEKLLRRVGTFYNADIRVEEMYMFENDLYPLKDTEGDNIDSCEYRLPDFRVMRVSFRKGSITLNGHKIPENDFIKAYQTLDPDIIYTERGQRELIAFFQKNNLRLSRYGKDYFPRIQGNSYFSYGQAYYRETPIYAKGRLLINFESFMVDEFNLYSILEGARICRMRIQRLASHSVGAAVTNLLTYTAYREGYLIPYKVGVYENMKTFKELIEVDRGPLTLEPYTGTHTEVAELDFVSMYPAIISRYNLSPEKFRCTCCKENIIDTTYTFCQKEKGVVPKVCDFLMGRRKHFKEEKDNISRSKAGFLKWLLVVIFGFQAFRNKKIGSIEVHEAINALARNTLLRAIHISEELGFEVVHGVVDSLYVKKKGITKEAAESLAKKIQEETGLPIEFKKIYSFITFLPSVNNKSMPVPTSYYGVGLDGEIKVRGIEIRTRNAPSIVKSLQREIIENMNRKTDLRKLFYDSIGILKNHIDYLSHAGIEDISMKVRIGQEEYAVNCAQKVLKGALEKRGVKLVPGQTLKYFILDAKNRLYKTTDEYSGLFDRGKYVELLKKAFLRLFLPFDIDDEKVELALIGLEQKRMDDFVPVSIAGQSL